MNSPRHRPDPLYDSKISAVFVRWEKWRLFYNLALAIAVFAGSGMHAPEPGAASSVWRTVLLANLAFSAGHLVEAAAVMVGLPNRLIGAWCLTVGTSTAVVLMFVTTMSWGLSDF